MIFPGRGGGESGKIPVTYGLFSKSGPKSYSLIPNCRGGVAYKIWIFLVNFGFLRLNKWKNKFFRQILDVVSFTTDHDEQFYTHFIYLQFQNFLKKFSHFSNPPPYN